MKKTKKKLSASPGFTLIELLITTTVIGLVLSIGLASYTKINRRQIFHQSVKNTLEDLRLAQDKALSGEKPVECLPPSEKALSGYRFSFINEHTYQIRAVCQDLAEESICKTSYLTENVAKTGGPDSVFFKVLTQGVDLDGQPSRTINLEGFGFNEQIIITEGGEIYPASAPTETPIPEPTSTPAPQDCQGVCLAQGFLGGICRYGGFWGGCEEGEEDIGTDYCSLGRTCCCEISSLTPTPSSSPEPTPTGQPTATPTSQPTATPTPCLEEGESCSPYWGEPCCEGLDCEGSIFNRRCQ